MESKNQNGRLRVGDPAPNFEMLRGDSSPLLLSELWQAKPVLVSFLRHFG